jgi:hypothetical protein
MLHSTEYINNAYRGVNSKESGKESIFMLLETEPNYLNLHREAKHFSIILDMETETGQCNMLLITKEHCDAHDGHTQGSVTLTMWHPLYPQKLALTSKTSGDRSVGIVR